METIEQWALREGVRQVQKQCGKASQWCDHGDRRWDDFDEADAEFWLRWASEIRSCVHAVVGIVDRQMAPSPRRREAPDPDDDEMMPRKEAEAWPPNPPRREPDGTPKDPPEGLVQCLEEDCGVKTPHEIGSCEASRPMSFCDIRPDCDLVNGHEGKCQAQ